jgi:hypothetical protein
MYTRVARFFLVQNTKTGKNIPNYHKLYQISIKYNKDHKMDQVSIKYINMFQCKTLQNLPKFGFLVWKQTIWQPWCMYTNGQNHIRAEVSSDQTGSKCFWYIWMYIAVNELAQLSGTVVIACTLGAGGQGSNPTSAQRETVASTWFIIRYFVILVRHLTISVSETSLNNLLYKDLRARQKLAPTYVPMYVRPGCELG